ncbi:MULTISPECIES: zinc-dependent alcohol dehydrogenase family protein [Bacillaceae]|uniref:Alcohol dehydrogenase n=1 Tax=Oceanobacillus caeni TaxID=405946 RepID=A0ABR5MN40_9BACI|nr:MULTISPECIES: zinc-dependent alcohol dehydrogenase family protein [Bacillaceae]KKE79772.1 alcohol dehydrogenase [Bacilli bacterium VT-13-104]PZD89514.1 alcohol dehydrogenase [Bacilli bacterium]KPH78446.1 alcohol dehydrogenase [Oceanobacillus caeni]MBU8789251.1 zinc-dependent alcohol dehydrogenase family protein [Oceanobacillus caeni]MED4474117.1 zinc-dependent alcohol dehydrogenase family protein [Oceanobacillus caeni]
MKAAQIIELKKPLRVGNVPDPTPGPHDVIVKVEASGVCRSDWHTWMGDLDWVGLTTELPLIPGHEMGGVVAEVGKEVKNFKPGDRVSTPFHEACTHCSYCLSGRSNICEHSQVYGTVKDGAYAEYINIPNGDFNLVHLPDEVDSLTAAAIGCRYMTGFHGISRSNIKPGEWLVVNGTGGVGLSAVQVGSAVGAQVIAVDVDDKKLDMARKEGAVVTINARKENVPEAVKEITKGGAQASIDALGIRETILNSILSLRKGGRHVQIGITTSKESGIVDIPIDVVTLSELEIIGSYGNPRTEYDGLLGLIAQGKLNPKSLISREISLDGVTDVFNAMSNYQTYGFNIITDFS